MTPKEVFLCHASQDAAVAERFVVLLRKHGVPVWYSPANILAAQQWHDEIGAALQRCDWFLILLSPASVDSIWVKRELLFALQQEHYHDSILPVVLAPCAYERLSWTLASFQMISLTVGFDDGCRALLRVWGIGYQGA
jgi:hypothetical protein